MPELPEENKQRAREVDKSIHFLSLFLTIVLIITILLAFICNTPYDSTGGFCKDYRKASGWVALVAYMAYWIECCCSGSQKYLSNDMETLEYEGYMRGIKASAPQIGTRIECYHYETRTRTVYYTDSKGKSQSRTETYRERVTTYTGSSYFNYSSWQDTTGEVVGVIGGDLVKLEVIKAYEFGNYESARRFEAHREDYIRSNRWRDVHLDSYPIFEVPGHKSKVLVQNKGTVRPCCLSVGWFWVCTFFLLSWPYRMWFEFISDTKRMTLRKVIYA